MNDILETILRNPSIPSPPTVAARILELVAQPETKMDELAEVLGADPKVSARIIAYCNSPVVGSRREIASLSQAVVILGMRTVRLISLSFSILDTRDDKGFDYESFWRRSLATAIAAQLVAERSNGNPGESFLQGLVLSVGEIGLANAFPVKYSDLVGSENRMVNIADETSAFGLNRYDVGARLLEKWNFPTRMVNLLNEFDPRDLDHRTKPFRLAQLLAELLIGKNILPRQIDEVGELAKKWFEIDAIDFARLYEQMAMQWKSYEALFQFESVPFESLSDLESQAKQLLIASAIGMENQILAANDELRELKESSQIDVLTKLKNRQAYESEVPGVVDYHRRQLKSFGILVIDIDHFKSINDTYGHAAGDIVLQQVGECLKQNCRKYDTVYRYGGEEFVALIVDCNAPAIEAIANRFRTAIEALRIEFEQVSLQVTVSVGVCWAGDGKVESLDELFRIADAQLYDAKKAGRNCCVLRYMQPTSPLAV
ncbi:MAG: GGDEF domain-containing protein [Pirellulaceae bacterium]